MMCLHASLVLPESCSELLDFAVWAMRSVPGAVATGSRFLQTLLCSQPRPGRYRSRYWLQDVIN